MDFWLQEKYILLLSNRLERFKRKSSNLFNFRCPFCGDSQKNKAIARGYFYKKGQDYKYHCHNCPKHGNFPKILKEIDPGLYFDMVKESYGEGNDKHVEYQENLVKVESDDWFSKVEKISDLSKNHPAYLYLWGRILPKQRIDDLYYCSDFRELVNSYFPDKLKDKKHAVPRIIIPFFDTNGKVFGFQGRAIDPEDDIRYISIILDDSKPKVYNLNNVDFNKKYYVFEGPFDSMFFENSIAVCGSDVLSVLNSIGCNKETAVIVFDNEPRNDAIVSNVRRSIMYGWNVCIWPDYWSYKDINDAIKAGEEIALINHIVDSNTYSGMEAELKLTQWRKNFTK